MTTREQYRELMKQKPTDTEKKPVLGVYTEEEEKEDDQKDPKPLAESCEEEK